MCTWQSPGPDPGPPLTTKHNAGGGPSRAPLFPHGLGSESPIVPGTAQGREGRGLPRLHCVGRQLALPHLLLDLGALPSTPLPAASRPGSRQTSSMPLGHRMTPSPHCFGPGSLPPVSVLVPPQERALGTSQRTAARRSCSALRRVALQVSSRTPGSLEPPEAPGVLPGLASPRPSCQLGSVSCAQVYGTCGSLRQGPVSEVSAPLPG